MMRRKDKRIPFLQLPNHRKKEQYINIKNHIRSDFSSIGFYFHTIDCLDEDANATWADIYFLSKKYNNIFYNATIDIAQSKLIDLAREATSDACMENIVQFKDLFELKTNKTLYDKKGKPFAYGLDFSAWYIKRPELNGKSVSEYEDSLIDSFLEKKPDVYEEYILHDDFAFGVGLDMIVDEEKITYEIVNKYIQDFYEKGEIGWKSDVPVDSSKLIYSRDWSLQKNVSLYNSIDIERM